MKKYRHQKQVPSCRFTNGLHINIICIFSIDLLLKHPPMASLKFHWYSNEHKSCSSLFSDETYLCRSIQILHDLLFTYYSVVWKQDESSLLDLFNKFHPVLSGPWRYLMCAPYGLTWKSLKQTRGAKQWISQEVFFFFFNLLNQRFDHSKVENFLNRWKNTFHIRGTSRHEESSCERSSEQTRKGVVYQPERCTCEAVFFTSATYVPRKLCGWRRAWQFTLILFDFV